MIDLFETEIYSGWVRDKQFYGIWANALVEALAYLIGSLVLIASLIFPKYFENVPNLMVFVMLGIYCISGFSLLFSELIHNHRNPDDPINTIYHGYADLFIAILLFVFGKFILIALLLWNALKIAFRSILDFASKVVFEQDTLFVCAVLNIILALALLPFYFYPEIIEVYVLLVYILFKSLYLFYMTLHMTLPKFHIVEKTGVFGDEWVEIDGFDDYEVQ